MKKLSAIALCAGLLGFCACSHVPTDNPSYTDHVNVFIGTGGHGHTFPGATLPHGMVQLSPDTRFNGWDACAGYHYDDTSIAGFSHTHLSGTGIGDYGDILFMPVTAEKPLHISEKYDPENGYRSRFSHERETARPGYYKVTLDDDSIIAELTATLRTGWHRYTYPTGASRHSLIVDMEPSIHSRKHPVTKLRALNDSVLVGMRTVKGWAPCRDIYFYAVFSAPFKAQFYADADNAVAGDSVNSANAKAVLTFDLPDGANQLLAKVGLSAVDENGAHLNLEAEAPGWDFDAVAEQADEIWNNELARIDIETDEDDQKEIFYTSLYHTLVQPGVASDTDGRYRTMAHEIARDTAYTNYTVFSLWDTFRALHPLYTLITPDDNQAYIRSLLRKYDEQGILPKWELASNETGTMIGYHAVSVIVDAAMKGQCDFDLEKALEASIRSSVYDTTGITPAMDRSVLHHKIMPEALRYKNLPEGIIPCDKTGSSVALGLEFAYNDWLIARLAERMGREDLRIRYDSLAQAYRHYLDPSTKKMRGRLSDGSWTTPFDPCSVERPSDYVEGNAWQWSWFVPQDIDGFMSAMGGKEVLDQQLDSLFTMSSELTGNKSAAADVTGLIGQYAHGNEPSHHIPYIYNYIGEPRKTQALVDHIMRTQYHTAPDGLAGNEDVGQMSAWYALSSLGLYSFCPGKPSYAIGRPMFRKATLHLADGKTFSINVPGNAPEKKHIRSMKLNGKGLVDYEISHTDIMNGGELTIEMEE